MAQENFRASNPLNVYYTGGPANNCTLAGGRNCVAVLGDHTNINECLFGGNQQIETNVADAEHLFCVAVGDPRDGGFWIRAHNADDPADWMVLNADNEKTSTNSATGW